MATFRSFRYVDLGINPLGSRSDLAPRVNETIEAYLTARQFDWYRYSAQGYIAWTNDDLAELSRSIANLPGIQGIYVLAVEFTKPECNGMMPPKFWTWLNQGRNPFG
jgi:hypothetical protein